MFKTKTKKYIAIFTCLIVLSGGLILHYSSNPTLPRPTVESPENNSGLHSAPREPVDVNRSPTASEDASVNIPKPPAPFDNYSVQNEKIVSSDSEESYPLRIYRHQALPNDPNASQNWTEDASIEEVWDVPQGENQTTLAIIDGGFGLEHEEFEDRWFINQAENGVTIHENPSQLNCTDQEIPLNKNCNLIDDDFDGIIDEESGTTDQENPSQLNCTDQEIPLNKNCNLIDDDSNELIDDSRGWDFVHFDRSVQTGDINPTGDGVEHATYVTGVAAATGNNSTGMAGVDWKTNILPLQAIDDDGNGNTLSVARAIYYAVAMEADVISLSLGSNESDPLVREAVQEAVANGIVVVAASGNNGCDCMVYPARYPETIAVGALNSSNVPASFSSWGPNLDILAPGVGFYTTSWSLGNKTSAYASNIAGTSLATPVVSATLTRLLSHQPNLTPIQLIAALNESTNRGGLSSTVSHTNTLGFGQLDASAALTRITSASEQAAIYEYAQVSSGATLTPNSPDEAEGNFRIYTCINSRPGTTPVYLLQKGSVTFLSASISEVEQAKSSGYTASFLAYGCITQPEDSFEQIRNLNTYREFKNIASKRLH